MSREATFYLGSEEPLCDAHRTGDTPCTRHRSPPAHTSSQVRAHGPARPPAGRTSLTALRIAPRDQAFADSWRSMLFHCRSLELADPGRCCGSFVVPAVGGATHVVMVWSRQQRLERWIPNGREVKPASGAARGRTTAVSRAGFDGGSDPWFRPRGERAFEDAKSEEVSTGVDRARRPSGA